MGWQEDAIKAFDEAHIGDDGWYIDADGDVKLDEDGESPGWLLWCGGDRLRMDWGSITFESDVQHDVDTAARWLLDAANAWGRT